MKKYYGGLFFVTLSTLALQVAVIRYFSIALWSNYGYMVISIALFGFGVAGTLLTMTRNWFEKRLYNSMYIISLLIIPVSVVAYIFMKKVPFNALQIINPNYTFTQLLNLSLYFVILFFPFFLSGMYVGLAFLAHKNNVTRLYFYDMMGAGTGTLVLLLLMFVIHPAYLIIPIIALFFVAHCLTIDIKEAVKSTTTRVIVSAVIFALSIVGISFNSQIEFSPQKDIRHTMNSIDAKILTSDYSPLGLLNIVKSTKERSAPGLSGMAYQMIGTMPRFLGVYVDGDQSSSMMAGLSGNTIDEIKYLPQIAPFTIKNKPGVLILGMGGGRAVSVSYNAIFALNFLNVLQELWFDVELKKKVEELKKRFNNPQPEFFKKILEQNEARLKEEVKKEWETLMADEANRVAKLKPLFNQAYENTVRKYEALGARYIDAVELNEQLIKVLKHKVTGPDGTEFDGPKFTGGLLYKRNINVYQSDIRGFLRRTERQYDIIEMSLYSGGGMSTSGNLPSHENYLYTTHSIRDAYKVLTNDGILTMTIDAKESLRDALRLFTTTISALENEGDLKKRFFIFRTMTTVTIMVKKSDFTEAEINTLKSFCDKNSFDPEYFFGINTTGNRQLYNEEQDDAGAQSEEPSQTVNNTAQENILRYSLYKIALAKFVNNTYEQFIEEYPYIIKPVTDNRPYFAYKLKIGQTLKALFTGNFSLIPYQETNYLILWLNLAIAIFFGALIITLPLVKTIFNPNKRKDWQGGKLKMIGYFVCLGFGFLFVEMVLIQKFVLFLTNPIYSTSLVLAGILTFSGLGSYFSNKFLDRLGSTTKVMALAISIICGIVVLYIFVLDPILRGLMFLPLIPKFIIALIFIAPAAFFLGMPFPLGLTEVNRKREDFLPWAWGINGATSVASTVLATILSISTGFYGVWIAAIIIYGSSYFLFPGKIKY